MEIGKKDWSVDSGVVGCGSAEEGAKETQDRERRDRWDSAGAE